MHGEVWTGLIATLAATAIALAVGLLLDWSDAGLGWAVTGACAVVVTVWSFRSPPLDRR